MKDYATNLNKINEMPSAGANVYRGMRAPVKAMSAGEANDPGHSATSPQQPATWMSTNNPANYAAAVVIVPKQ